MASNGHKNNLAVARQNTKNNLHSIVEESYDFTRNNYDSQEAATSLKALHRDVDQVLGAAAATSGVFEPGKPNVIKENHGKSAASHSQKST